jgi:single-strand DNA-binding protein
VHQLPDERKVLSFSLAVNDYYQSKTGEVQKLTTYFECAYWRSLQIAPRLTKGTVVEITGRLYTKAFISKEGTAKATLHCHVSTIKIHAIPHYRIGTTATTLPLVGSKETIDDLPF